MIAITTSPVQSQFYFGFPLNVMCHIQLVRPLGRGQNISAQWRKSDTLLTSNSGMRVDDQPIAREVKVNLQYYFSLVFSSLDKRRDDGNYTCSVTFILLLEATQRVNL